MSEHEEWAPTAGLVAVLWIAGVASAGHPVAEPVVAALTAEAAAVTASA